MENKAQRDTASRVYALLYLLRKQTPLTLKQEKFCSYACVERFLKANGDNVKRAAKQLRACLSWRETIGVEHLIADEFTAELADGLAYVAGHDDESRPVMVFRIKQDYLKFHSQKMFTRLLVFTLEVAVSTMPKNVQQFVMLFDASFYRSAYGFMNLLVAAFKITGEYYPGRLHKAFVIDPPSLFPYLWKGIGAFVELSRVTRVVLSSDLGGKGKVAGSCSSSRFTFTVSHHHLHSLKPWYLSVPDTSSSEVGPSLTRRSLSFTAPRTPRPSSAESPAKRRENCGESFLPYLKFSRRPYDEMVYRSKMRAPLGGLISIVSPYIRRQRFTNTEYNNPMRVVLSNK